MSEDYLHLLKTKTRIRSYGYDFSFVGLPPDIQPNERQSLYGVTNQNSMKRRISPFRSGWTQMIRGQCTNDTYYCGMIYPIVRDYDAHATHHFSNRDPIVKRDIHSVLMSAWIYRICRILFIQPEWAVLHPFNVVSGLMVYMDQLTDDVVLRKVQKDLLYFWTRYVIPFKLTAHEKAKAPFVLVRRTKNGEYPNHAFYGFSFSLVEKE